MDRRALLDAANAEFWSELCGSGLARALGITEMTPDSLRRFDAAYMALYPYLWDYVRSEDVRGRRVLEIGLGYGSLGQTLAGRRSRYFGLDVAPPAAALMRHRLELAGIDRGGAIQVGSALALPYRDASVDYVYSIGCLHHTGDLTRAIDEVARILVPGGKAIVMLYHRHSYRQWIERARFWLRSKRRAPETAAELERRLRGLYDTNAAGAAAPSTEYVSRREVRRLFRRFASVRVETRNAERLELLGGWLRVPRERLLDNVGRLAGLDLYVVAVR